MGRAHAARVPPLMAPLGCAGALPGNIFISHVWASPAMFRAVHGGIDVDIVRDLTTEVPAAWNLGSLVGLPVTYLNDIVNRCQVGLIIDIRAFLLQDWAKALFHDRFASVREQLEQAANKSEHMAAVTPHPYPP
ncbi:hypothetical protein T484DRAFT_3150750 [Baffinella frigidus]|nr:hypothetical protein T484DRAFT_3150750 [Cryptophyta sp. CCMP2293]